MYIRYFELMFVLFSKYILIISAHIGIIVSYNGLSANHIPNTSHLNDFIYWLISMTCVFIILVSIDIYVYIKSYCMYYVPINLFRNVKLFFHYRFPLVNIWFYFVICFAVKYYWYIFRAFSLQYVFFNCVRFAIF